jgi:hypothetical protein
MVRAYLRPLREQVGRAAYRDRQVMMRFADGIDEHPRRRFGKCAVCCSG